MDISIVIINYNTLDLTEDCIETIKKYTKGLRYEIILIDNNSSDGSQRKLRELQDVRVIFNRKNTGFIANNQGMKIAKGDYILLLNSDTVLTENSLLKMYKFMQKNPDIGIASCALKNSDGSMQGTGGYFPTLLRVFNWMFFIEDIPFIDSIIKPFHPIHPNSKMYKGTTRYNKSFELDWVTGAFFMMRRELLTKVGFIDPEYFMYTEEVDYCYRAKKLGYKVYYTNTTSIIHLGGASSPKEFPILSEYKNIQLFYKKHMPKWQLPFLRIFLVCGAVLRRCIYTVLGKRKEAAIYAKAQYAHY